MDKQRRQALLLYQNSLKKKKLILLFLLERHGKGKKDAKPLFKSRKTEGTFEILVNRHLNADDVSFQEFFRVTRDVFYKIVRLIKPDLKPTVTNYIRTPITAAEKFAVTLRFLVAGETYRSLAFAFRISHSWISRIVPKVLTALCRRLTPIYLPPVEEIDFEKKAEEFLEKWNFPNLIGAIDGKHVRIVNPDNAGSLYFNYKNFFSIVLLAIVDANYKFMVVDIGSYGKEADPGIFDKSVTGQKVYDGTFNFPPAKPLPNTTVIVPHVIVGDEAFRLDTRVLKPYPRDQSLKDLKKTIFNYRLSRARRVTENAFGILCQVFRIFFSPINVKPETVDKIVLACCCLHNLLIDEHLNSKNSNYEPEDLQFYGPMNNMIPLVGTGGYAHAEGFVVREVFMEYFNGRGSVPWQMESVSAN